jgi:hypothetical protein
MDRLLSWTVRVLCVWRQARRVRQVRTTVPCLSNSACAEGCGVAELTDLRLYPNGRYMPCRDNELCSLDVSFPLIIEFFLFFFFFFQAKQTAVVRRWLLRRARMEAV